MRFRLKPWIFLALLAALICAALFSIDRYRHRFIQNDAQMFAVLPKAGVTRFFVNVSALRRSGMLSLLAGSEKEDPDYQNFVRQTHFDYQNDADAIAGTAGSGELLFVVRGRFDWGDLQTYATTHGGRCDGSLCSVPASKPGQWASFLSIQPDVIGLAVSSNPRAAQKLRPNSSDQSVQNLPSYPVWVQVAPEILKDPVNLPFALRVLAIWLQSADRVALSLGPASETSGAAFRLILTADFPNQAAAKTARNQFDIETKMLKLELAREHQQPSAADLTGLLAAGTFDTTGSQLKGYWPVSRELLNNIRKEQ